jgi:hypothetical protein
MMTSPVVSWLFFKARAKRPYLNHTGQARIKGIVVFAGFRNEQVDKSENWNVAATDSARGFQLAGAKFPPCLATSKIEEQFEYDGNPVPRCTAPALVVPTQTRTSPAKQSITPHE